MRDMLGKRESNPIWFWRHLFANISLKMLGIHKVFLCFLPHLGRKSVCQNCLHLKKMRFACSQVFLRRRNTSVFQGEKRLNVREAHFLRHIGFDSLLANRVRIIRTHFISIYNEHLLRCPHSEYIQYSSIGRLASARSKSK